MSLNSTPSGERPHIAFFGCRNAGKSSLINSVTGQSLSIVSDVKGTTTDPVYKAMELLPAGPVMIVDTPGLDDEGELGQLRIDKALQVLRKTNMAILVVDSSIGITEQDEMIFNKIRERQLNYILVMNKSDLAADKSRPAVSEMSVQTISNSDTVGTSVQAAHNEAASGKILWVSTLMGEGIQELKEQIAALINEPETVRPLVGDLVETGDTVLLVVPIDKAAPKGRLILPQQQVIRDLLDHGAIPMVVRDSELKEALDRFGTQIKMVITDSQAFARVSEIVPRKLPLTSFSILFSRYKGELEIQKQGLSVIRELSDGDKVLIAEGCTHHRQCGDIGRDKIPALVKKISGHEPEFVWTSGTEFPEDLGNVRVVIHCGGCMLNEKEMKARIQMAVNAGVPITNYGMTIAMATGVLERSLEVFDK